MVAPFQGACKVSADHQKSTVPQHAAVTDDERERQPSTLIQSWEPRRRREGVKTKLFSDFSLIKLSLTWHGRDEHLALGLVALAQRL